VGVLATLLIGTGVLTLFAVFDIGDIGPVKATAAGLAVVGVAMVVGAWRGNARPLLALGLPALAVLVAADLIDVPFDAGFGDRTLALDSRADLDQRYELTGGTLTIDLGDVPLGRSRPTLEAQVGFGDLIVIVPPDVAADVEADVGLGEISGGPAGDNDGVNVERSFHLDGKEGGGRIDLDLKVGAGQLEVRRG